MIMTFMRTSARSAAMRRLAAGLAVIAFAATRSFGDGVPSPPGPAAPLRAPADSGAAHTTSAESWAPADAGAARTADRWLWVTRGSLRSPAAVDEMVARAQAAHVRGLLVQVVGRGDAYFRSDLLPRAEALPRNDFDPLARVLADAHAAGLEVHAWMNCVLVWSAPRPPRDPRHVLVQHPEWVARLADGRPMTRLSPDERRRLGVEGVFLAPGHPAVRAWIAAVAREIAGRYAVDGIHLDYIRNPGPFVGFDGDTRARFAMATGVDPAHRERVPATERATVDSAWTAFQRAQVTAVVRQVRDSLRTLPRPVALSAAVLADTISATRGHDQSWPAWLREGLLDRVFVMCYAPRVQTVLDQMVGYARQLGTTRVVPGIAVFNTGPTEAAAKLRGALELGYRSVALYSYDVLAQRPGDWPVLAQLFTDWAPAPRSNP